MSTNVFRDEPIPLIYAGADDRLELNIDALNILNSIPRPIAVVGVAGQYRTGKSYLLNKIILNRNKGFGVGSTVNSCTKGIWMWGKPIKGQTKDGKAVNVIVLDSEGLGAVDVDTSHDSRIFSLVMLLSSCFIYNSMGSIDEMALENLGLIIDLTKNIQIKSSANNEDAEYEDFAFYMPAFLWVVRDFALELVDQQGNELSQKSYLENSLKEQAGFSEQIEQKNRIRRLLTAFFQDRECFTMVRPAVEEEALRNIEKANQDFLRPEFIEQMVLLRKMILSNTKVKTLENVELNGEMLGGLVKSYLVAINDKKVPVIENCWTYICKNQCNRAYDDAFEVYSKEMNDAFEVNWPMAKQILKSLHKECKDLAIKDYKKNAVGDYQDEFLNMLVEDINKKYQFIKNENVSCFETFFKKCMQDYYDTNIDRNLKTRSYKSFIDLDRDIKSFENYFQESDYNGPNKTLLLAEFLNKNITVAIYNFISQIESNNEEIVRGLRQKKNALEDDIKSIKDENERNKKKFELSLNDLKDANDILVKKMKVMDETFEKFKKERNDEEERSTCKFKENINSLNANVGIFRKENDDLREKIKALERELIMKKSEFEESSELLTQQVQFYEQRLKSISQTDESRDKENLKLMNDFNLKLKENSEKFEKIIESKETKVRELNEHLSDYEERIDAIKRDLNKKVLDFESKESFLNNQLQEITHKYEQIQEKLKSIEEHSSLNESVLVNDQKLNEFKELSVQLENEKKQSFEKIKLLRKQYETEKALQNQTNEFLESKCSDLQRQLDDTKRLYEATLNTMESTEDINKSDISKQLIELSENKEKQIKSLEHQLEVTKNELNQVIYRLTSEKEDLEKDNKYLKDSIEKEVNQLREDLESSDRVRLELKKELTNLENEKDELFRIADDESSRRIRNLEDEIRKLNENLAYELENQHVSQDEELKKMKFFYNSEKEKQELIFSKEKEKYDKKISDLRSEYEDKLHNENFRLEQEIENLQSEIQSIRISNHAYNQSLAAENSKRAEHNQILENQLQIITEEYEELKNNFNNKIAHIAESYENDKTELMATTDILKKEKAERDNEFWNLSQKLQSANAELSKVTEFSTIQLGSTEKEIIRLKEELEDSKSKGEKITNETVEQKIELGKKIALASQQNQFLTHRIEELTKQIDYSQKKLDERLQLQKEDFEKDITSLKDKFNEEKTYLESKYESKRKALKEIERTYAEKIAGVENSKGILQEKLNQLKAENTRAEATYTQENKNLQLKIDGLNAKLETSNKDLTANNEKLKKEKYKLEMDNAELQANLEKETALYNGKLKFLEEQKEQLKLERDQSQKNFELMLQKFQKLRSSEKEENINSQSAIIANVESRCNAQINEINNSHRINLQNLQEKNNKLEKEIKNLNEKLLNENNARFDNYHQLERKLNEKNENEKLLQDQITKIKQDRDSKVHQAQKKFEDDLERYRKIITEMELKLKEADKGKTNAIFEIEKSRAMWIAEKDNFQRSKDEIIDSKRDLERSRERLIKENEKLKNENKKFRLLGPEQNPGMRLRFPGSNNSKVNDRSFGMENDRIMMRNYNTRDNSKNFLPDNISDNDSQANKLLNELNQN
jgi:hypothetical protein